MAINTSLYTNKIKTNLWSNKTFTIFYYNFKKDTKRYRGLIDLSDKVGWNKRDKISVAEAELIQIKNKKNDDIFDDNISLDNFMIKHFEMIKKSDWKRTKTSHYKRYISPYIGKKKLTQIRQLNIKSVIKEQEDLELAPRTVKQTLEVLNPAFKEAIANRLLTFNPCEGLVIKLPKTKKLVVNASDKLMEVYNAIVNEFKDDPFYQAFYLFALQGRRKGEIINLKWEDISFSNDYYILRDTKNDETQKMYLPNNIKDSLVQFKEDSQEYVFTSRITGNKLVNITGSVGKLKKVLGADFGIHYLRNVISSAMGEVGLEAIYQSGALGHSDLTTINKYSTLNYHKGSQMASNVISDIINK